MPVRFILFEKKRHPKFLDDPGLMWMESMSILKNFFIVFLAASSVSLRAQGMLNNIAIPKKEIAYSDIEIDYPDIREVLLSKKSQFPDNPVKLEALDYSITYVCGVVANPSEMITAEDVLTDASTVFSYFGVVEKWVPINGKSDQYYVFKLK